MKYLIIALVAIIFCLPAGGQNLSKKTISKNYYKIIEGSSESNKYRIELSSDIDTSGEKWNQRAYNFGFNPQLTPMYTMVDRILATPYVVQVRGNQNEKNKKRWGLHVFEGYAKDDKYRITMFVYKHIVLGEPVAQMYYYETVYNHSEPAYKWFRIGSDVKQHSFLFSRDKAMFYGSLTLSNAITLG